MGHDGRQGSVQRRSVRRVLGDHTFRSLRHRNYRLYFFGQIVSLTGSWMQSAALMWLIYDRTNDPIWPALLLVAQVGPTLLLGTWGGVLADRLPKRQLVMATQASFLVTALTLTFLVASNFAHPWLLFAVQLVNGVIQAVDLPTRFAFVPNLVPKPDLMNAVSLNALVFNVARAIGPALAGGLFWLAQALIDNGFLPGSRPVMLGAIWCFTLNSTSYIAVLMALQRITVDGASTRSDQSGSVLAGFWYVWNNRRLKALLVLTGIICVFAWPALTLFPAYTKLVLNHAEKEYSLLVSSLGAGALISALIGATFGTFARRGLFLAIGAGFTVLGLTLLSVADSLPLAIAGSGSLGFGLIFYLATGQSTLQLSVADDMRGRVMSLWAMMLSASAPVGHLLAGWAAQTWPIRNVFIALTIGAGMSAIGIGMLVLSPGWKRLK